MTARRIFRKGWSEDMYKIAAIGDFENTAYFGAIGAEVFCPQSQKDAVRLVHRLKDGGHAVIFISEKYYTKEIAEVCRDDIIPAVIPLPLAANSENKARKNLSSLVKQAVGSDIIFGEQEG